MRPDPEVHPTSEDLERFVLGDLEPEDSRQVLQHLLTECPVCRETTGELWAAATGAAELARAAEPAPRAAHAGQGQTQAYDQTLSRVFDRVRQAHAALQGERAGAEGLLAELMEVPRESRRQAIEDELRFQSWGLCELLLARSQEGRYTAVQRGVELAEAAVAIAERLDPAAYDLFLLEDLRARSWAYLANARRVISDFRGAEQAFQHAEWHLGRGTGDRLEKARIYDLKASLRTYQWRHEEALRLLNRAIAIYRRTGQSHLQGRALLNKAHVNIWAGDNDAAIEQLRQGLELLDPERDAKLTLTAYHNLAFVLNDRGQHREAAEIVARSRPLYLQAGDPVQLQYLEARIAMGLGELERAEATLKTVRSVFVAKGMAYDAALASLDLAEVYARLGRPAEMRVLGRQMLSIFQSRELHREAIAVLILFQKTAEASNVTVGLVQELAARVQRIRRQAGGGPPF